MSKIMPSQSRLARLARRQATGHWGLLPIFARESDVPGGMEKAVARFWDLQLEGEAGSLIEHRERFYDPQDVLRACFGDKEIGYSIVPFSQWPDGNGGDGKVLIGCWYVFAAPGQVEVVAASELWSLWACIQHAIDDGPEPRSEPVSVVAQRMEEVRALLRPENRYGVPRAGGAA